MSIADQVKIQELDSRLVKLEELVATMYECLQNMQNRELDRTQADHREILSLKRA